VSIEYLTVRDDDAVIHATLATSVFTFCGQIRPIYRPNEKAPYMGFEDPAKPVSCMLCLMSATARSM
jgi:hypothetical protein